MSSACSMTWMTRASRSSASYPRKKRSGLWKATNMSVEKISRTDTGITTLLEQAPEALARAGEEGRRIFGFPSRAPYVDRWQWDMARGRPTEPWQHLRKDEL